MFRRAIAVLLSLSLLSVGACSFVFALDDYDALPRDAATLDSPIDSNIVSDMDARIAAMCDGGSPVYQVSKASGDFIYTLSAGEAANAVKTYGYVDGGVVFTAYAKPVGGGLPVYRLQRDFLHFYTVSPVERDEALARGYVSEDIGFSSSDPERCGVAVHRLQRGDAYQLTTSEEEIAAFVGEGWIDEGPKFTAGKI